MLRTMAMMIVGKQFIAQQALLHCVACCFFASSALWAASDNAAFLAAVFGAFHRQPMLMILSVIFVLCRSPWQAVFSLPALLAVYWRATRPAQQVERRLQGAAAVALAAVLAVAISYKSVPLLNGTAMLPYAVSTHSGPAPLSSSWYLLSSAFLRYMPYYTWLTWAHPLLYAAPLLLRFKHRPEVALIAQLGLVSLFDPSSCHSASRWPVPISLGLALCPDIVEGMRGVTLPAALLAFSLIVAQPMKSLWMGPAHLGNANFLFNHTVLVALCGGSLVAEFCLSAMRAKRMKQANVTEMTSKE